MTLVDDRLDATFTALADPARRAIVARLATGTPPVNELAQPFDMSLPGISKHLKVLERCGLIARPDRAQFRPCPATSSAESLDAAIDWIEENRRAWMERFDKLDAYLYDIQRRPSPTDGRRRQSNAGIRLRRGPPIRGSLTLREPSSFVA